MRLIGIPRVSSSTQKKGDSVESQIRRFKDWCLVNNHKLVDIWTEDVGRSATMKEDRFNINWIKGKLIVTYDLNKRPAIDRVFANSDSDEIDGFLIFKWDRIFRNPSFADHVQTYLLKKEKKIIPTDDPEDPLASDLIQVVSKYESTKNKERVKLVRLDRFQRGLFPARSPFGYKPILKDKKIVGFKPDKKEAEMVKQIFERTAKGEKYSQICKNFKIKPQSYYNILKNKVYCGYVVFENSIKKGVHSPIIDEETFIKCQTLIKKNQRRISALKRFV